jgi:energy-coupling factor transporter ATP-binding protein EcfA2
VDDLRRGGRQHHHLVGDRGSGKTTLLLRLAAAIEDDTGLARTCVPLRFPEEQYNISQLSDLWTNAIDALVDALERQGDRSAATRLESAVCELDSLEGDERTKQALAVLEGWTRKTRRLIVLLVDNLDLVLERLAESLWELRETLSVDNGLVVIGASSKFIEEAIDYQSPFYDFFHVHELVPLSEAEARNVVLSLARRANTPRVVDVLEQDQGRFKALYVLTGGTPRTLALLHSVLALDGTDSIERDLDGLLDQVTPYYKARFDDLPAQSQVILDKVALHWHPITAASCQEATRLEINIVSAQLSRLARSGLLTKVALPDPGKLGFQVTERFFNIWYLMRASRRLRRRLTWFVEFLKTFYGAEALRQRAEALVSSQPADRLDTPAKLFAFASAVPDDAHRRRLELRAINLLVGDGIAAIREVMDLEGEDLHLAPVIDRVHALHEIRARIMSANIGWPAGWTSASVAEAIARDAMWPLARKRRFARLASHGEVAGLARMLQSMQADAIHLGDRLVDAIAAGEVPSLADAGEPDEIQQILELGISRPVTIACLLVAAETSQPMRDEVIRYLLSSEPLAAETILVVASVLVGRLPWARVRHLIVVVAMQAGTEVPFDLFLAVIRKCVSGGLVPEAAALLVDSGMAERWAPLHETLLAVNEGAQARLHALAPEMRSVAVELYEQFDSIAPSLVRSRAADVAAPGRRRTGKASKRGRGAASKTTSKQRGRKARPWSGS